MTSNRHSSSGAWHSTNIASAPSGGSMVALEVKTMVHGNAFFLQFPGGVNPLVFTPEHGMDNVSNHPWTDLLGERQGPGVVFRGMPGNTNFFHVSIPCTDHALVRNETPIRDPEGGILEPRHFYTTSRANLVRVFFQASSPDQFVTIQQIFAFDGNVTIPGFPVVGPRRLPPPPRPGGRPLPIVVPVQVPQV